jgi:hypothetical protein
VSRRLWRTYTPEEFSVLARQKGLARDGQEKECPACGRRAVRYFGYDRPRLDHLVGIVYVWCSHCGRWSSWTGQALDTGMAPPSEAMDLVEGPDRLDDPRRLVESLDGLWDDGVLP